MGTDGSMVRRQSFVSKNIQYPPILKRGNGKSSINGGNIWKPSINEICSIALFDYRMVFLVALYHRKAL